MRIAVDAMGGDHAPGRPVDGALAAARYLGLGIDLVGRAGEIRAEFQRHPDVETLDVRVVAAHAAFGMLPGVDRPALAPTVPTRQGSAVLLDVGATVACRPSHLLQFAHMGAVYSQVGLGVTRPRIGLLSIGEEETKGNQLTREAHQLIKASSKWWKSCSASPVCASSGTDARR